MAPVLDGCWHIGGEISLNTILDMITNPTSNPTYCNIVGMVGNPDQ